MRVLVVEDDPRMASMLRRGLSEDGYCVDVVEDGAEAVWLATDVDYDIIVLDIMLPTLNGFEVCRRLREADRWAPVLMLTARLHVQDRVAGLDSGADDYLAKPFSFSELTARIRALVRRGAPARPAVLVAGDLRLDPATHTAWRGRTELKLSPKELALLDLFMRRKGELLSRSVIREHTWDFASEALSNVIDQYVAAVRRKIDRPFGLEQLETVRGSGYRLRAEPRPATPAACASGPPGTSQS